MVRWQDVPLCRVREGKLVMVTDERERCELLAWYRKFGAMPWAFPCAAAELFRFALGPSPGEINWTGFEE
jgi:hypothetical protein